MRTCSSSSSGRPSTFQSNCTSAAVSAVAAAGAAAVEGSGEACEHDWHVRRGSADASAYLQLCLGSWLWLASSSVSGARFPLLS